MQKVTVTINDMKVEAEKGQSILQAALNSNIYIPHLCSHPDLTPQGGCKLCLVEIEGTEGAVASCNTLVEDGMVIKTKSEKVNHLRAVSMELMLASHPSDCTSCSSYLNCEFQALMQYLGTAHSRMRRIEKNNTRINNINALITRDMQRCIQCGRCIRACSDIRNVGILGYNQKNKETYVGTKKDLSLKESDCRFCGACVEVCPTGALRDVEGVFSKDSPRELAYIPCKNTCPANIDIPTYVRLVSMGQYSEAVGVIREKVPFPHSLGYVCTHKCEESCRRGVLNSPVSIKNLKRFAVAYDKDKIWKDKALNKKENTGKKVAIIGAGASGLTAAYYLSKKGHDVTVYEKLPVVGGMMGVGIPEYRIPRNVIESEVDLIKELGVKIVLNFEIKSLNYLADKNYDAILIAIGTHKGKKLPIDKSDYEGVYSAVDFLEKVSLKELKNLKKKVTVVGGGNVAFDCARSAKRLGACEVNIICLEPRCKMLADEEEVEQAIVEGINVLNSKTTLGLEGKDNKITGIKFIDVKDFSFGSDGKLNMTTVEGSEQIIETDIIIFAIGQVPLVNSEFGVALTKFGYVAVNYDNLNTDIEGVFSSGDTIYGTKSVIEAIASGRKAAENIDRYLGGDGVIVENLVEVMKPDKKIGIRHSFAYEERQETCFRDYSERIDFNEVDLGLDENKAIMESNRCLQCDLRLNISKVKFWTEYTYK